MASIHKKFFVSFFLSLCMTLCIGCSDIFSSYPPPSIYKLYPGKQLESEKIVQLDLNRTRTTIFVNGFRVSSYEYAQVDLLPGKYKIRFVKKHKESSGEPFMSNLYDILFWYSKSKSTNVTCDVTADLKAGHSYEISSEIDEKEKQYCVYITDEGSYEDVQNCCDY